jgi:two-component system response regulator NreC
MRKTEPPRLGASLSREDRYGSVAAGGYPTITNSEGARPMPSSTPAKQPGRPKEQPSPSYTRASGQHIRVLIVDDHTIMRQLLQRHLEEHPEIEVAGCAANGREAVDAVEKLGPDVVLMDQVMPGLNGLEATRQIRKRFPKTRVLILTGYMEDEQIVGALRAGASGYVVKASDAQELILGIQSVHRGNTYFSAAISGGDAVNQYLWQAKKEDGRAGYDLLTSREREVLQLIAEGFSNQRIAQELFISVKTVEAHKAHIMSKLHARNRTDLIRYALRKGLVGIDAPPDVLEESRQAG